MIEWCHFYVTRTRTNGASLLFYSHFSAFRTPLWVKVALKKKKRVQDLRSHFFFLWGREEALAADYTSHCPAQSQCHGARIFSRLLISRGIGAVHTFFSRPFNTNTSTQCVKKKNRKHDYPNEHKEWKRRRTLQTRGEGETDARDQLHTEYAH